MICGKPVDNNGTYVDYLKQDKKNNCSRIVDKSDPESKRAELEYKVLDCIQTEEKDPQYLSLVEISCSPAGIIRSGFSFPVMEPPFMEMANTK